MTNANGAKKVKADMEKAVAIEPGDDRPTVDELFESMNGFEEIAVEKMFGVDPFELAQSGKQIRFMRALVFLVLKREGKNDFQAHQDAMAMRIDVLQDFFAAEDENEEDESPKENDTEEEQN